MSNRLQLCLQYDVCPHCDNLYLAEDIDIFDLAFKTIHLHPAVLINLGDADYLLPFAGVIVNKTLPRDWRGTPIGFVFDNVGTPSPVFLEPFEILVERSAS